MTKRTRGKIDAGLMAIYAKPVSIEDPRLLGRAWYVERHDR
jgi:hypothetical protein